ncbi:MAG: hypothetical protein ACQESE_04185 [Nanobdellota archaeon]
MTFLFCPECGSLLKPESNGRLSRMVCSCGYTSSSGKNVIKENVKTVTEKIEIIPEINPLAKENHVCSKCGFDKAQLIIEKSDGRSTWCCNMEGSARYVCGKCGFSEKAS